MLDEDIDALARRILAAADAGASIAPVAADRADFGLDPAYRVSARIAELRRARGETPVGWKIGFTNRTIWDEYDVRAPIWGPMYDSTFAQIAAAAQPSTWALGKLVEPRIEPEICFRIASPPSPDMDERALIEAIDGVAHGFEIVQSVYPGWKFAAPDTVAAFALHGGYRCGPFAPVTQATRGDWVERLTRFEITLSCDAREIDRGLAANVLDGPLSALLHFVRGLEDDPLGRRLKPGDVVTTGTVTRAFPVAPGERWATRITGLPLPGLDVIFA